MGYAKPKSTILAAAMEKPKEVAQEKSAHLLLTIPEAYEKLRISKTSLYRLLNENKLKAIYIGGRRLIPRAEVDKFISAQLARGAA